MNLLEASNYVKQMGYNPSYEEYKINALRNYVRNYIDNIAGKGYYDSHYLKAAASIMSEEIKVDPDTVKARYIFFNNLLFNGELPVYSVKFYVINKNKKEHGRTILAYWNDSNGSITVCSDEFNSDYSLDETLVHEMCHTWQDRIWEGTEYSDHGPSFQYIQRRTEKRSNGHFDIGALQDVDYRDGIWNTNINKLNSKLKKYNLKVVELSKMRFKWLATPVVWNGNRFVAENNDSFEMRRKVKIINDNEELKRFMKNLTYKFHNGESV